MDRCRKKLKTRYEDIPAPGTRAIAPLLASLQLLPADAHASRIAIIESLGETGDPAVLRALFLMATARGNVVRQATALALGRIRHSLSAYLLIPMLADGSSRVRNAAMESLIRLGFAETEEVIMAACRSNNRLRDTAAKMGFRADRSSETPGSIVETASFEQLAFPSFEQIAESQILSGSAAQYPNDPKPDVRQTDESPLLDSSDGIIYPPERTSVPRSSAFRSPAETEASPSVFEGSGSQRRLSSSAISTDSPQTPDIHQSSEQKPAATSQAESGIDRDDEDDDIGIVDSGFFDLLSGHFDDSGSGPSPRLPVLSGPSKRRGNRSDESSSEVHLLEDMPSAPISRRSLSDMTSSRFASLSGSATTTMDAPPSVDVARAESNTTVESLPRPAARPNVTPVVPSTPVAHTSPPAMEPHPDVPQAASPGLELPPLAARIPLAGQTEAAESAPVNDAAKETRERQERNVRRLKDARETAFRQLLEAGVKPLKVKASRSVARRQAQFEAVPHSDLRTVCALIQDLARSGSPAVMETLVSASSRPQKDVRAACAAAFGTLRIPESLPPLLRLLGDKSGTVIEAAVRSLSEFTQPEIRPVVLAAGMINTALRTIVVTAVEQISDAEHKSGWEAYLLSTTDSQDHELAAFAIPLLARITGAAHRELYEKLTLHEAGEIRAAAVDALIRTGEKRVISAINSMFADPDPRVRSQAALAAASLSSPRTIQLLVSLLFDASPEVRRSAACAASQLNDPELGPPVAAALEKEQDQDTIEHLLVAIGNCSGTNALRVLTAYMDQHDGQFRDHALRALRKLKLPESAPVFLSLLDDASATIRRQSIEQLGVLKATKAIPRIREKLRWDTDENVRAAAARALGEFHDKDSLALLQKAAEEHAVVKIQAVIALGNIGLVDSAPLLLTLLKDVSPEIRYQAIRSLVQIKATDIDEALLRCLDDSDELVRRGAEQALLELGFSRGRLRRRQLSDRLLRLTLRLTPSSMLGAIPGGGKTVLATLAALVLAVGAITFYTFRTSLIGAPALDAERVVAMDASTEAGVVAVLRQRGVADIWSTADGTMLHRMKVPDTVTQVFMDRRGNAILVMDNQLGRLKKADDYSLETMDTFSLDELPSAVCRLETQDALCVFERGNPTKLRIIGLEEFSETRSFSIKATFEGLCYVSPDLSVAMMLGSEGRLSVCQLETGDVVTAPLGQIVGSATLGGVMSATFSGDAKYAAFACTSGCVVVDARNMRPVRFIKCKDPLGFVSVQSLPDSSDLILLTGTGQILQLKKDFQESAPIQLEREETFDVCTISPDGKQVLAANTESSAFDVYSVPDEKLLLSSSLTGQ